MTDLETCAWVVGFGVYAAPKGEEQKWRLGNLKTSFSAGAFESAAYWLQKLRLGGDYGEDEIWEAI